MDGTALKRALDGAARAYDMSGAAAVYCAGETLYRRDRGYADRQTGAGLTDESRYLIAGHSPLLLGVCALILCGEGALCLSDRLSDYVPEYARAGDMTVSQVFRHASGVPDFMTEGLLPALFDDPRHRVLPEAERVAAEKRLTDAAYALEDILPFIQDRPPDFPPGASIDGAWSASNVVLAATMIERAGKTDLLTFERERIFEPLGMDSTVPGGMPDTVSYASARGEDLIRLEAGDGGGPRGAIATTAGDVGKLARALAGESFIAQKAWREMARTIDAFGRGAGFDRLNGTFVSDSQMLGWELTLYVDRQDQLCYFHLSNACQSMRRVRGEWRCFRTALRETVEAASTWPASPALMPYNARNMRDAMALRVSDEQLEFVTDAKTALCEAYAQKAIARPFVLTDHGRAVGLIVLIADPKADRWEIENAQIDARYQRRGYGRILLTLGIDYLKKRGAKTLEIGVNRANLPALGLYRSLGFEPFRVFDEGVYLRLTLQAAPAGNASEAVSRKRRPRAVDHNLN